MTEDDLGWKTTFDKRRNLTENDLSQKTKLRRRSDYCHRVAIFYFTSGFQAICGTESYPANFRAKKYKIKDKYFSKADFQFMMSNLPVPVKEEDIDQMFEFADKDKDGKISYRQI